MPPSTPSDLLPTVTFFGDASSKDKAFMVAGGFVVGGEYVAEIDTEIEAIRSEACMSSEFHWSNYRGGLRKEKAYKAVIDLGFSLMRKGHERGAFHTIIAKFEGYDHRRGGGQNKDTSVNRMYYQLCLHRLARFYGHARQIHVRLDAGNDSEDIVRMRNEVCAAAYKMFRGANLQHQCRPNCIRSIQAMSSKASNIIQMADVILGGIAAKRNEVKHTSAKSDLADYVLEASPHKDWSMDTPRNARHFTVWNHRTKGGGIVVPRSLSQGPKP